MNRINFITAIVTLVTSLPVSYFFSESHFESKKYSGFIIEEEKSDKIFYLQDIEGGDVIELYFENEDISGLDFQEFEKVEVFGIYNSSSNKLTVSEIEIE